jgi:hypothetical protein
VKNKHEGELLRAGLADPTVRAFVQVMGALAPLSEGGRRRVLSFVADKMAEEHAAVTGS